MDCLYALYGEGLGLQLSLYLVSNRVHGVRKAEGHVHVLASVVDADTVDEAGLHEVHPQLRVHHRPGLIPRALLGYHLSSF